MKNKITKLGNFVLDLIFPPICFVCRKRMDIKESKSFICFSCFQKIKINSAAFCPVCSRRLPENKKTCHQESQFILAAAGFYGDEILDPLITLLKYQKIKQAAIPLGEILSKYLNNLTAGGLEIKDFLIIPVPLHWRKERQRGFNQANLIADCLSKNTGLPVAKNILKRIKNTASQVELKDKDKREINVLGCFEVAKPELVSGKNIILLDDVFTTGATMREAASVIKKSGARKIIGLVVAKT
ncbi:MAG: ComF family protein [bacterium]|nr:ComF family protein [bacterium]